MTVYERQAEEVSMREAIGVDAYDTLTRLNWDYGFGDLAQISFDKVTGIGKVTIRRKHMLDTIKRFKIEGNTVFYRRHQGKVKRMD